MQKAKFKELYDYCQTCTPYIGRSKIRTKLKQILPHAEFMVVIDHGLDPVNVKGYFVSARNTNHAFVKHTAKNVVVIAKDLNECWKRFVTIKEMMHLFDDSDEITDSPEKLAAQLNELDGSIPNEKRSPQMVSEIRCFWMSLACVCPEAYRAEFAKARANNETDDYAIAVQLKIPEQYVPSLFRADFNKIIASLIN